MTPFTGRIACVFYLLLIFYSAEAFTLRLPNCEKKLRNRAIQNSTVRERLAVGVIVAKPQVQGPKYICALEERAYDFVRAAEPSHMVRKKAVFYQGTGRLNLKEVLSEWNNDLKAMGEKEKFGCNLYIYDGGHKVACLFK